MQVLDIPHREGIEKAIALKKHLLEGKEVVVLLALRCSFETVQISFPTQASTRGG